MNVQDGNDMRRRYEEGERMVGIAAQYGVSVSTVHRVIQGKIVLYDKQPGQHGRAFGAKNATTHVKHGFDPLHLVTNFEFDMNYKDMADYEHTRHGQRKPDINRLKAWERGLV